MDPLPMKTTMTAVALVLALSSSVLALSSSAFAQDVKQAAPATAPATTAPAVTAPKPVAAPEMKVGAPTTPAAPVTAPKVEAKPATSPAATAAPTKTSAPAVTKLININSVALSDLEKLPKIGEARAKQIVAGRPYKSVDDLMAKKILPQDAFDAVKSLISVQ